LNVTIPHKQRILPMLDRLSATAQEVGAVNTVFCQEGKLMGENTDVPGFAADLQRYLPDLPEKLFALRGTRKKIPHPVVRVRTNPSPNGRGVRSKKEGHALVLGAGGSARAVVCALGRLGWRVGIAARRLEQAQEVAGMLSKSGYAVQASLLNLPSLAECLAEHPVHLIVNTTPLGMGAQAEISPWFDGLAFPRQALVYDLIYNPVETLLMRQAQAAGLQTANGWGMLLEQAALSFACWTGIRLEAAILRRALEEVSFDPTD
jgi:shikimate dehydrogenase